MGSPVSLEWQPPPRRVSEAREKSLVGFLLAHTEERTSSGGFRHATKNYTENGASSVTRTGKGDLAFVFRKKF